MSLKPTGLSRIIKATRYSFAGIKAAWKYEAAFRQEFVGLVILIPLGLFLGKSGVEKALLISSPMIVILTELINSALEAVVDRIGLESHPLAGRAKDMGSAAVFVSILIVIVIWTVILI
ncbi:MAG: diacylglycerol kinase [Desulfobacteraceae bacterium]|nr:diacylglycerol kinase [Desulfobacteraceae bacterium]